MTKLYILFSAIFLVTLVGLGPYVFSHIGNALAFTGPPSGPGVGSGAIAVDALNNVAVGTTTVLSDSILHVVGFSSDSSSYSIRVFKKNNSPLFFIRNDGKFLFGTASTTATSTLRVNGAIDVMSGGIYFPDGTLQTTAGGGGGAVSAVDVTPGEFNSGQGGGGNYLFPANLTVDTNTFFVDSASNRVGILHTTPADTFTVGATDQFRVNSTGNLVRINNVQYSWPASVGAINTVLRTDASGNLTWVLPSSSPWAVSGTNIFTTSTTYNVGIGNSNPTQRFTIGATNQFQVNSTGNLIRVNDVLYSWPGAQGSAGTVLTNNGAGTLTWTTVSGGGGSGGGPWFTSGTNVSLVTSTNEVIKGSGVAGIELRDDDFATGFWIRNDGLNPVISTKVGDMYYGFAGRAGLAHIFHAGTNGEKMRIDTNGNVAIGTASADANYKITTAAGGIKAESTTQPAGYFNSTAGYGLLVNTGSVGIGTTIPKSILHVAQNDGTENVARAPIIMSRWWGADTDTRAAAIYNYYNSGNANDQLVFGVTGGGGAFTSPTLYSNAKMVVQANGNVGIGTTAPGQKLSVVGTVESTSGGFRFPDGTTQTTAATGGGGSGGGPWLTSGTNVSLVTSTNRVGIGIASPSAKLHLSGGDANASYINATIALGYDTSGQYPHFIHTRHNGGTTALNAIDFYTSDGTAGGVYPTNAVHAMTLEAGNVGIGDTSPADKFTVGTADQFRVNSSGNLVRVNNVLYSWPGAQGVAGTVLTNNGAGTLTWTTPSGGGGSGGGPWLTTGTTNVTLVTSTNEIIKGSGTNGIELRDDDNATGFWIRNDGANPVISTKVGDMYYGYSGRAGLAHIFHAGTNGEVVRFDNTGNIRAQGSLSGGSVNLLTLRNTQSSILSGSKMTFADGLTDVASVIGFGAGGTGFLEFQTNTGGGLTSKITIRPDGNVGIGDTNPTTAKLVVVGTISVSNNRIINVDTPTASTDAATKAYVDTSTSSKVRFAGYTFTGGPLADGRFTGILGGGKGGNAKCQTDWPGSHWANANEIIQLGSAYPWTSDVWLAQFVGDGLTDCSHWTNNPNVGAYANTGANATIWHDGTSCSNSKKLACVY